MPKADLYPKYCKGCGKLLIRKVVQQTQVYDGQTGERLDVERTWIDCPDFSIGMPTSPITGVRHDHFEYDIKK